MTNIIHLPLQQQYVIVQRNNKHPQQRTALHVLAEAEHRVALSTALSAQAQWGHRAYKETGNLRHNPETPRFCSIQQHGAPHVPC